MENERHPNKRDPPRTFSMGTASPLNDPQRERVYAMETSVFKAHYKHRATLADLQSIGRTLCRRYGMECPSIIVRELTRCADYDDETDLIRLDSEQGRNYTALCHELAHYVVWRQHPRAQDHGPLWVAVYADLLEHTGVLPQKAFRAIARSRGVRFSAAPR